MDYGMIKPMQKTLGQKILRPLALGISFAAILILCPSSRAEVVDGIAAVVNEDIITISDVKNMVGKAEEDLRRVYAANDPSLRDKLRGARKEALDQLIERRLIIQQFNTKGGKVPDSLVEEDIEAIIEEQYGRDRSVFIKTLEALGLNLETYKERVRDKIIVRYMQQSEVTSEVIISPYKIEKYYNENFEDFKEGEKIKLSMIYIKKGEGADEIEGARSLAQEILVKINTGSEFSSLEKVYSENQKGNTGFVGRDTLRKELADVAFDLKPGQVSKVIETKDGLYILQVEEKKPAKITTMEESRDLIERLLVQTEREQLQKRWLVSLRRKAYIRLY